MVSHITSKGTIIITGGAGFIGSNLVRLALTAGYQVVNIDKLTYAGNLESLSGLPFPERYHFFQVDICDTSRVAEILRSFKPIGLINCAAESHVDRSIGNPGEFIQTNIVGTYSLLEAAKEYWLRENESWVDRSFRFIQVSTDEVYGDVNHPNVSVEGDAYYPNSPYSASKASSDHLVRSYYRTYQFPTITTHCTNNFGPFQLPEKLIPKVILNAKSNQPIPIYGDGKQVRDWIHVFDHCKGLLEVFEKGEIGTTYNIGASNLKSNFDVAVEICNLVDQLNGLEKNPRKSLLTSVSDRPGHDRRYALDPKKIQTTLGWKADSSFSKSLEQTVRWYLQNEKWVTSVTDPRLDR